MAPKHATTSATGSTFKFGSAADDDALEESIAAEISALRQQQELKRAASVSKAAERITLQKTNAPTHNTVPVISASGSYFAANATPQAPAAAFDMGLPPPAFPPPWILSVPPPNFAMPPPGFTPHSSTTPKVLTETNAGKPASCDVVAPTSTNSPEQKEHTSAQVKTQYSGSAVTYDKINNPAPVKQQYERVNLHQLPSSLPTPPTAGSTLQYPSQEDVFGARDGGKRPKSDNDLHRQWSRQFDGRLQQPQNNVTSSTSTLDHIKTANIPFVSPFVQKSNDSKATEEFDSSEPPPT